MKKDQSLLQRMAEGMDLSGEPIPSQTIAELAGYSQVLVENHMGITQYSEARICIRVKFGHLAVRGCNLELRQMTRERLVIGGRIDGIDVLRRQN